MKEMFWFCAFVAIFLIGMVVSMVAGISTDEQNMLDCFARGDVWSSGQCLETK